MYLCILVLPFLSFFSTNLFGRFIGVSGSCCLSTASIFCSFLLSFLMFYESSICSSFCTVTLCKWFHSELFISFWAFYFDSVSVVMLLVVSGVSMLVHFYSIEYMAADEHQSFRTGCGQAITSNSLNRRGLNQPLGHNRLR